MMTPSGCDRLAMRRCSAMTLTLSQRQDEIKETAERSNVSEAAQPPFLNECIKQSTAICALCVAEKGDSTAVRKKRRDLEGEAGAFVEREVAIGAGRVAVVRARRLARSIDDTYDEERYKGLHRAALLRIEKWLAEATTK